MKINVWGCLIEWSARTHWFQRKKNLNSVQCTAAEKIKKNSQKWPFFQKLPLLGVFLDFFSNGTSKRVEIFCVAISVFWRFIWAIKHHIPVIFIFWPIIGYYKFSDPSYGGVFEKKNDFFCIFLTSMYRSSDLAGSKHDWS